MLQVLADNTEIDQSDINKISMPAEEKLKFDFNNLISAKISLELKNIDKSKYDDTYEGSFFNSLSWYNKILKIIDTQYNLITWEGRIKNLKRDEGKKILTIESTNYIKDIIDATCAITVGSLSDVTPAEIIYTILTDVVGIPDSAINSTSFDNAKAVQIINEGYIIVNYEKENNIQCSSVINEILRITSSYLYTINNIIYYHQFSPYTGGQNTLIDESMIVSASYSDEYNSENIYNDYNIAYKYSDSVVNYATPVTTPSYITVSKDKFGTKYFNVPDDDQDSTTPADFKILCKTLTSARYYGELVRQANHYMKKVCKYNIRKSVSGVYLNTFVDVNYDNFVREPMRITERKIAEKYISLTAEMLNFPYEAVERDAIKPDAVELLSVKHYLNKQIELQWTQSDDEGFYQYLIEFSTSPVDFTDEYSAEGNSPVLTSSPDIIDGKCRFFLSDLSDTARYYFRIKVQDTAGNTSDPSNVMTLDVHYLTQPNVDAEFYRCSGDLISGLTFTDGVGTPPASGYVSYDDYNYDAIYYSVAGVYTSDIFCNYDGFNQIKLISNQPSDYYNVKYRSYSNGVYGSWIDFKNTEINNEYGYIADIDPSIQMIQILVLFDVPNLYDTFTIQFHSINQGV